MSTRKRPSSCSRLAPLPICWTERARNDLLDIGDFIAADDPVAAAEWVERLVSAMDRVATMPFAGRRVPELGRDQVCEVVQGSYPMVYRVHSGHLEVLTVFEGHRQLKAEALPVVMARDEPPAAPPTPPMGGPAQGPAQDMASDERR
ncbi:MAG: type II toxin-antitoxin system RelE/ParE family toxin [Deltaproteobacteria bacterium]|nr:type II toxin-antitoxin system RelE/ParE family toxin [Deltaproteobacteria bacterium]